MILLTTSFSAYEKPGWAFKSYRIALCVYSFVVLVTPVDFVLYTAFVYNILILLYLPPIIGVVYLIAKMIIKNQQDAVYLFAAATGIFFKCRVGDLREHRRCGGHLLPCRYFSVDYRLFRLLVQAVLPEFQGKSQA